MYNSRLLYLSCMSSLLHDSCIKFFFWDLINIYLKILYELGKLKLTLKGGASLYLDLCNLVTWVFKCLKIVWPDICAACYESSNVPQSACMHFHFPCHSLLIHPLWNARELFLLNTARFFYNLILL